MLEFKKYPSIENHYRERHINKRVSKNPELLEEEYILTEKVDGSNFCWAFDKEGNIKFARRTAFLKSDENFYNYQYYIGKYQCAIDKFKNLIKNDNDIENIRVCCELYGSHVLNRVNYGNKGFVIFDIYINERLLTPYETINLLTKLELLYLYVPIVDVVKGLQNALDYEIEGKNSLMVKTEEGNIMEGVVIKPYKKSYVDENGTPFYIKKKTSHFLEKENRKPKNKKVKVMSENLMEIQEIFKSYLVDSRVAGVMSKYGMIQEPKQIGQYIKYVLEDAKEDFFKDNIEDFNKLEDKEKGQVFGVCGKVVVPLLHKYL